MDLQDSPRPVPAPQRPAAKSYPKASKNHGDPARKTYGKRCGKAHGQWRPSKAESYLNHDEQLTVNEDQVKTSLKNMLVVRDPSTRGNPCGFFSSWDPNIRMNKKHTLPTPMCILENHWRMLWKQKTPSRETEKLPSQSLAFVASIWGFP